MLITSLITIGVVLILAAIISVSDNLIQIEALKNPALTSRQRFGLFPSFTDIFGRSVASHVDTSNLHNLKRGHDIKLVGEAREIKGEARVARFAVKPNNFRGIAPIPKMVVQVGDEVAAGDALFFDKGHPEIMFSAPVSGEIVEIRRGPKRAITDVIILADKERKFRTFDIPEVSADQRKDIIDLLISSGAWMHINQRPFDIIPDPERTPDNIFVSTFKSSPLAPDYDIVISGSEVDFQKGLDVLNALTSGKVYLGLNANKKEPPAAAFTQARGVEKHWFRGAHPSGNVGVQIHHVNPIRRGSMVWTLGVQDVVTLGHLFNTGQYDPKRVVALTGSQIKNPGYVRTHLGANIGDLIGDLVSGQKARIISGDVLSGAKVGRRDFLHFQDDQVSTLSEGDYYELFGWLLPKLRPSISRALPGFLLPNHKYEGDTNTHGERRAFVISGQYESVLPMNIYPQHLMKAILTSDLERMEGLGINELSEEDIALCEFTCTSKVPLQSILREGLDMMREQG